jgi:hypothetical protein
MDGNLAHGYGGGCGSYSGNIDMARIPVFPNLVAMNAVDSYFRDASYVTEVRFHSPSIYFIFFFFCSVGWKSSVFLTRNA